MLRLTSSQDAGTCASDCYSWDDPLVAAFRVRKVTGTQDERIKQELAEALNASVAYSTVREEHKYLG